MRAFNSSTRELDAAFSFAAESVDALTGALTEVLVIAGDLLEKVAEAEAPLLERVLLVVPEDEAVLDTAGDDGVEEVVVLGLIAELVDVAADTGFLVVADEDVDVAEEVVVDVDGFFTLDPEEAEEANDVDFEAKRAEGEGDEVEEEVATLFTVGVLTAEDDLAVEVVVSLAALGVVDVEGVAGLLPAVDAAGAMIYDLFVFKLG
jgi:AcrR family transcriptional regulator